MKLIDKDAVVAEINRVLNSYQPTEITSGRYALVELRDFLDTLEVKDPYEQCVQYDSIKAGIQAHAETYSFNIQSELFNQLTKEQQALWRKEIEQACISGGDAGVILARDQRYKENLEVKDINSEYVRKDVFIEKAVGWIDYQNGNGGCNFRTWEKEFRKEMEEEQEWEKDFHK